MKWDRLSALLVDVGGTLVDESGWAIRRARYESLMLARLRNAFGREHDWFTNLIRHLFAQPEPPDWEQRTTQQVAGFLATHGMDASPSNIELVCRACAVPLGQVVNVAEGAREAILEIRRLGVRIAICSNTWWRNDADSRRDWDELGLGQSFDAHVTSHDVGRAKPHPAIFERALAAVEARAEAAAMIGDRLERDVAGARAVGMRAIWLNPGALPRTADPPPDAEVAAWAEVTPIVRAWRRPSGSGDGRGDR
jgi:HAD superfamily hydrolase (TIGR01509 family)